MDLAENLIKLRKEKGLTQEQTAQMIGVSRQAVSKWESGNGVPDINNLIEIAKLYQVNIDDLLMSEQRPRLNKKKVPKDLGKSLILISLGFFMGVSTVLLFYPNFTNGENFVEYEAFTNHIAYLSAPDFEGGYKIALDQVEETDSQFISVDDCRLMVVDDETVRIRFSFVSKGDFYLAFFTPPAGDIFNITEAFINQEDQFVSLDLDRKLFNKSLHITMNCYPVGSNDRADFNYYSLNLNDLNRIRYEIR